MSNTKKGIIGSICFVILAGLIVLVCNLIFKRPNNHNESMYGVQTIHLVGWESMYREWATNALPELNRLGPTFRLVSEDDGRAIQVFSANLQPCVGKGVGRFTVGTRRIEIDPVCVHSSMEFQAVFIHEIGHFFGMTHICRVSEAPDGCSPVGHGVAVMNPNLIYESPNSNGSDISVLQVDVPTYEVQSLDVKEFLRVYRRL